MKKLIFLSITSFFLACSSCGEPPKKEEPGVKIEGKKGGEMKVDKDKLEIEGKKGGELRADSNGVKIKEPPKNQ
jgi:hypothetical protein